MDVIGLIVYKSIFDITTLNLLVHYKAYEIALIHV